MVDLHDRLQPTGNASIVKGNFTGRFFQPVNHTTPQVWWGDDVGAFQSLEYPSNLQTRSVVDSHTIGSN